MSTYTNDENIRFLNDKNISQTLGDSTARKTNTVPSLDLLNEVNNALTAYDSNLCAYLSNLNERYEFDASSPYLSVITKIEQVKGQLTGIETVELLSSHVKNLKEFVEDTINDLDVSTLSAANKFVRTLEEIDGKIQATFSNVLSSDLDGQLQQTQVENLTADLDSCYKKAGGLIDGDAQVNGQLSVMADTVVDTDATVRGNLVQGRGTSYTGDAQHSVVLGISATTNKDDVFLWNGKQNEAYIDHGRGTFNINAVSGVNGVFVGNQSLEKIVDDKRELARTQAKEYTDEVSAALSTDYVRKIEIAKNAAINTAVNELAVPYVNSISAALSTDYVGKIATAKAEAITEAVNVYAKPYTNSVSVALSTDYVGKIATAKSEAIEAAAADATDKVNALDTNLSNVAVLVSSDLAFNYDESTRLITLNLRDYTGHDHTFTIDSARFIKGRIVDHVNIVKVDNQDVLRIWWTTEEGGTGVYSDVPLATLAQVYNQGEGISIVLGENGYVISVNDTIVNKTFLNSTVATINADISEVNDKANLNTVKIASLAEISAQHDARIAAAEGNITTAQSGIQTNATDIATANGKIATIESYVNQLSTVNGIVQTLSNAINTNAGGIQTNADGITATNGRIDTIQNYVDQLSTVDGIVQTLSNAITANHSDIQTNAADIALTNSDVAALQTYATQLSTAGGIIQVLSNAITANADYAHDKLSGRLSGDEMKIDELSAQAQRLQAYTDQLSSKDGIVDTIHDNIDQLSTSIINANSYIGEVRIDYNELTAGTPQAWVTQNGNELSSIIKHFNLAPLGYVKNNTIIKVAYVDVPAGSSSDKLSELKYQTSDGILLTDNDYIIIHGNFERRELSDIVPSDVDFVNAVKRNEYYDLSVALSGEVDSLSAKLSGEVDSLSAKLSGEIDSLSAALSGEVDSLSIALSGEIDDLSTALSGEIDTLSVALSSEVDSLSAALSGEIDDLSADLSGEVDSLSAALSGEIDDLSADLSGEIDTLSGKLYNALTASGITTSTLSTNVTLEQLIKFTKTLVDQFNIN